MDLIRRLNDAIACHRAGRLKQAEQLYREILKLDAQNAVALHYLGLVTYYTGRQSEGMQFVQQSIGVEANDPAAHCNLAVMLAERGANAEATQHLRQALAIKSDYAEAHNNLGVLYEREGQLERAEVALREAVQLQPKYADALNNLGNVRRKLGRFAEALHLHQSALASNPAQAEACSGMAETLEELGRTDEAIEWRRRWVSLRPDDAAAHSSLLYMMLHSSRYSARELFAEHQNWESRHAKHLFSPSKFSNDRSPDRPLRVGYVSPDFREHTIARFIAPVLAAHDHKAVIPICYSDVLRPDEVTDRIRTYAAQWRAVSDLSDEQLAQQIRDDRIDILVDLTGHMARNRLLVFARKPAPVQATYLGYPHSTGLSTIDYRITDHFADPIGLTEPFHTEQLIRLDGCAWCYEPTGLPPASPRLPSNPITFGSFNRVTKITNEIAAAWARILDQVPDSRLVALAPAATSLDTLQSQFAKHGVAPERLVLAMRRPRPEFLRLCGEIDIALDTYPYNGMTTTCDLLASSAPVVTLAGITHVSRVGASLLSNVGLEPVIANTIEDYIELAVEFAKNVSKLSQVRQILAQRFSTSTLCDREPLTRQLECSFNQMWVAYIRNSR